LDAGGAENLQDIREYLGRELRPSTGNGAVSNEIVDAIVERSEGLFLYVSWVRQELQDGRLSLARVEEFPRGLGGVYADFFQRYFPDPREYVSECRPALEAICAVREPLARQELADLLGWSEYKMRSLAARLGSLFPVVDGRVRPFHQSVRDWLIDAKRSGPYWIDISAQEQRLADFAWREYKKGVNTMGHYCIAYAPSHLAACQMKTELGVLLLAPDWIQAKLQTSGVTGLLADYDLALDILSPKIRGMESGRPRMVAAGIGPQMTAQATTTEAEAGVSDDPVTSALRLLQGAIRLSSNVIAKDPAQFASQMVGRLLPHWDQQAVRHLVDSLAEGAPRPWMRLMHPTLHPPGTALIRTLEGHTDGVHGVAVSPDGRCAVSASSDKALKVWDLETGRELRTLQGHADSVNGVAVSSRGRRAVSASFDEALKVWDLEAGRELHTLRGHSNSVHGVAVSPDGRHAVSASGDKTLKVWELESPRQLRRETSFPVILCPCAIGAAWQTRTVTELRLAVRELSCITTKASSGQFPNASPS
jgi:hypothetical protein